MRVLLDVVDGLKRVICFCTSDLAFLLLRYGKKDLYANKIKPKINKKPNNSN